jgi:hypothetical protein
VDNTNYVEFLKRRREVLLFELQMVSDALEATEEKLDDKSEEDIAELESDVIAIMKSGGVFRKKGLATLLKKRNPNLQMDYPTLMKELSSIFFLNPYIKSVAPYGWEYSE